MRPDTFSIGLKLGLCAGHFLRVTYLLVRYVATDLARCDQHLSSCSTTEAESPRTSYMNGRIWLSITTRYTVYAYQMTQLSQ